MVETQENPLGSFWRAEVSEPINPYFISFCVLDWLVYMAR